MKPKGFFNPTLNRMYRNKFLFIGSVTFNRMIEKMVILAKFKALFRNLMLGSTKKMLDNQVENNRTSLV